MGSRKQWAAELTKRFEAIEWTVELVNNGHYKVTTHDGNTFGMASSPSDTNAEKVVIRQANRYGFRKREQMFALKRERDRLVRLEEGRAEDMDEGDNVKVQKTDILGKLGYIGTTAITEIGPAVLTTPRTPDGGTPLKNGEKVTLVNGQVRYRCTVRTDTGPCYRDFSTAQGVASHWKAHNPPKHAPTPKTGPAQTAPEPAPETGVIAKLTKLIDDAEALGDVLDSAADGFASFKTGLHELVQELPDYVADAETREKVKKYEQLRELLK
jgi:hypothetical protein